MPEQANLRPLLTVGEVNELLAEVYPQLNNHYNFYHAVEVFPGGCTVRLDADERHLRRAARFPVRHCSRWPT